MTDYKLKNFSRKDLLEMLIAQSKEIEILRDELALTEELANKQKLLLEQSRELEKITAELENNLEMIYRICPLFTFKSDLAKSKHISPIKVI